MKLWTFCLALGVAWPSVASAESLRCDRGIVAEGDSRLSVIYKCGEPYFIDTFCDPVYYGGTLQMVPTPLGQAYVPCLPIQEWLYERGPGEMVAVVRMRWGTVQSIKYGREPQ
jgi:hypothetical protein